MSRCGVWRCCSDDNLREVTDGIQGARVCLLADYGNISLEEIPDRCESPVEILRLAVNRSKVLEAIPFLEKIKAKGYIVSLQCMAYDHYSDEDRKRLVRALEDSPIDYIYIADSYGSFFPSHMKALLEPLLALEKPRIGFHPHNNLEMAFANTLAAIDCGVHIVDSSIYGMGRGSGNLPTEVLVAYLTLRGEKRYNVIPILNVIDQHFVELKQRLPWGYQLPYMLSAMFRCHPNFATDFLKRREYEVEDIWRALEVIESMKPSGYDPQIVEKLIAEGYIGIGHGRKGTRRGFDAEHKPEHVAPRKVSYVDLHKGRDFLVLANGPSLRDCQPEIRRFIDKYDPVILGANHLGGLFIPHYHAFNNKKRFSMYAAEVAETSRFLIGQNIPNEMITEHCTRDFETLCFEDRLDKDFDIVDGVIQCSCRTISVLLLGVAVVMGAKRIFAAGLDGYMCKDAIKKHLFYDEKFEPEDHALNLDRHRWNEKFMHQIDGWVRSRGAEGIHILTPTSHFSFYKGIANYL